ncbi:MAG TPA: hypothetical protein ENF87_00690 [Thermoproteales archaeon]|nr:hypothetical protein [Thermoproteales archaeon]
MSNRGFYRGHPKGYKRRKPRRPRLVEAKPMPINGKCNVLCPLFRCSKGAYTLRIDQKGGRVIAYCRWVGDECIGYKCKFAYCARKALLPDGKCKLAFQRKESEELDIVKEAEKDEYGEDVRRLVTRRLGKKFLDELD